MPLRLHSSKRSFLRNSLIFTQCHVLSPSFLSCQAATVLQAAFRGHLARSKLVRSKAPDCRSPSLPGPPSPLNQVTVGMHGH